MSDDQLKNYVLALADEDTARSEQARLVILAALEPADDLSDVLGDGEAPAELVESLNAPAEDGAEPVGAYLSSITVSGFRGIGPQVTLPLRAGRG